MVLWFETSGRSSISQTRGRQSQRWARGKAYYYRPQTKFAKVMFSQVSVCPRWGVCPIACWDTHTRSRGRNPDPGPAADTPLGRHLSLADTPQADTPCTVYAGRYGQQAGGTHPTNAFLFRIILAKTTWKWKILDRGGLSPSLLAWSANCSRYSIRRGKPLH